MENYKKGINVEEPLKRENIPIKNLPANFIWMQVRGGTKIRNVLAHALNEFPEKQSVVWTGFGTSVGKAITCAELMKRECGNKLYQITKLCYRTVEEYWDPFFPELDQIVVKRKLPMIHIFLSVDPLDSKEDGYQAPGVFISYKSHDPKVKKNNKQTHRKAHNGNKKTNVNNKASGTS
ncbi:ribonuclease P protein subunit p25-like protein [Aethina tumida]|uniref:ribonuclease P protein subunit p25-like protein n=1 Tax=Aethina tumida TaxID=116153 RepID=UPI00096B251D|nr:ribonuclease P protein subunit p25-like protein [Aethina tumida]